MQRTHNWFSITDDFIKPGREEKTSIAFVTEEKSKEQNIMSS
jgi:hypothetical protein